MRLCGVEPDDTYRACVHRLRVLLLYTAPRERPSASPALAPFDQASQHPVFGAKTDRGSMEDFLCWARARPHPSQQPLPPLDADLEAAIEFVWKCGSTVQRERETRMSVLRGVADDLEPLSRVLCGRMSREAVSIARAMMLNIVRRDQPSAGLDDVGGRLHAPHLGLWCAVADALEWPHRDVVAGLMTGFRSVRHIPDTGLWRQVDRPASEPFESFQRGNAAWLRQCENRVLSVARHDEARARACWERTLEERDSGLIEGPFTRAEIQARRETGFPAFGYGVARPLPRFAIWQGSKWRCIDDGAASGTNSQGTSTRETIVCDRPDTPLRVGVRFHALGPPPREPSLSVVMGGGTDDRFAAFRGICSADPAYTVVCVAAPAGVFGAAAEAVFFRMPGHPFGLVSSVLNFNSVAELPMIFSRRFFGTPVSRFYDDHSVNEPSYAAGSGQACHVELHEILRFHFDWGKHVPWRRDPVYTGVQTDWSCDAEGLVSLGVTRDRRARVRAIVQSAIDSQSLTPAEASSLRNKARFCVCPAFGRVGVGVINLLRDRQLETTGISALTGDLKEALQLLCVLLDVMPAFVVRFRRERVRAATVVLTDASFATGHTWLGFLVCCPYKGARWAGIPTPQWLLSLLASHKERKTYIGQLEAAAAAAPYFSLPASWWQDVPVLHYIDNQGALYGFIKGRSNDSDCNRLVFITLLQLAKLSCDVWFDYVPSAANIADLPTRLDAAAFARLERVASRVALDLPPEWCLACEHSALTVLF